MLLRFKKFFFVLAVFIIKAEASVEEHFNQIKNDPNSLYSFFKAMPKGGELHYHLAGGVYPETLIALAKNNNICLNPKTKQVLFAEKTCSELSLSSLIKHPELYDEVVRAWSMKDFIPNGETRSQHFFATFYKFIILESSLRPQVLAETIKRASDQNELYLEVMILPDKAKSTSFGTQIKNINDFASKEARLLANSEFQKNIQATVDETQNILTGAREILGCNKKSSSKECNLKVKFQYYVLREQDINNFFAQAVNAFLATQQSKDLIAVNIVQAENSPIALRDYDKQIEIFNYLHKKYPEVNIALHAGELNPNSVTPEDLRNHISKAIFTGHAQRIGHGVTIAYEDNAEKTLDYMAKNLIPVEINLTSNKLILNIKGKEHPINFYLKHQVPIVLSTDDEGILRTDLTREFVAAVIEHNLDYRTIKQANRNTLSYSFLPGKSLWSDTVLGIKVADCQDLNSQTCKNFIKTSEKAQLQWQLEQDLLKFERGYN